MTGLPIEEIQKMFDQMGLGRPEERARFAELAELSSGQRKEVKSAFSCYTAVTNGAPAKLDEFAWNSASLYM